jgi:predicted MPP superfamily phosphohydrolase
VHNDLVALENFVRPLAQRVPVVLVAGNHEFYAKELNDTYSELRERAASISGLHFLEQQSVEIKGVKFLGATLWFGFNNADLQLMKKATSMMADFAVIADRQGVRNRLSPEKVLSLHRDTVAWLESELQACDPARTVVVTH